MDFCSVLLILADKDEKKSLTIFSTSRWKINVLHILGCGQLHVFLLKLNSAVPGIHIAFSLNPQQRSHLTQFFPEIPSFPIIVTLGNGPEIVKCVMSGGMYYPEFQIFSKCLLYLVFRWDLGQVLHVQAPLHCLCFTEAGQIKRRWRVHMSRSRRYPHCNTCWSYTEEHITWYCTWIHVLLRQQQGKLRSLFPEPVPFGALKTEVWAGDSQTAPCFVLEKVWS